MIMFDTLAYARALQKAGFTQEQAQIMAEAHGKAVSEILENNQLATRADLTGVKDSLENKLLEMETRLTRSFHTAILGMGCVLIGFMALALAILK